MDDKIGGLFNGGGRDSRGTECRVRGSELELSGVSAAVFGGQVDIQNQWSGMR